MLEEMVHKGDLGFLREVESALDDILARDVTETQASQLKRGQNVVLPLRMRKSSTVIACALPWQIGCHLRVAGRFN